MAGPGIPPGRRETCQVSLVDLMPTLCDLLGIDLRKNMQGRSFTPLLRGLPLDDRPAYFDGLNNPQLEANDDGLLMDGWKLIVHRQGTRPILSLYDFATDPDETRNRTGPSRRLQTMMKHLADIRRTNQQQLRLNIYRSSSDPNSSADWETQIRLLKSLGYIQE
jgi:arylsulfatase A-like enzyme